MTDEALDLTPLSIAEVEKFLFQWERVPWGLCPTDLKKDVEDFLGEAIVAARYDSIYSQDNLTRLVREYNALRINKFLNGHFCQAAELDFKLKPSYSVELWVDYYGITQDLVEDMPEPLKHGLMDKYLPGWREYVAKKENAETIARVLEKAVAEQLTSYVGKKNTAQWRNQVMKDIQDAIIKTGIAQEIHVDNYQGNGKFVIKIVPFGAIHQIQINAEIS